VIENTFRDVNIALANETALICEQLDINFYEVARLANRHPRVNIHMAGPGVGGHCISVDPWFLIEQHPETAIIISEARRRNDAMPGHVVDSVMELVAGQDSPKVAVLGLAFKGNVDDMRESPALAVISGLIEKGAEVAAHDPFVKNAPFELSSIEACFSGADCAVVVTDHGDYKYLNPKQLCKPMRNAAILDTRNLLDHAEWREAGFQVKVLGSGKPV
jgi:UDP-N-acetyl-D-mannosaminuronic acid dehydrogenase